MQKQKVIRKLLKLIIPTHNNPDGTVVSSEHNYNRGVRDCIKEIESLSTSQGEGTELSLKVPSQKSSAINPKKD